MTKHERINRLLSTFQLVKEGGGIYIQELLHYTLEEESLNNRLLSTFRLNKEGGGSYIQELQHYALEKRKTKFVSFETGNMIFSFQICSGKCRMQDMKRL